MTFNDIYSQIRSGNSLSKSYDAFMKSGVQWKSNTFTGADGDGKCQHKKSLVVTEDNKVYDLSILVEYKYRTRWGYLSELGYVTDEGYQQIYQSTQLLEVSYPMSERSNKDIEDELLSRIGAVRESYSLSAEFYQRYPPIGDSYNAII